MLSKCHISKFNWSNSACSSTFSHSNWLADTRTMVPPGWAFANCPHFVSALLFGDRENVAPTPAMSRSIFFFLVASVAAQDVATDAPPAATFDADDSETEPQFAVATDAPNTDAPQVTNGTSSFRVSPYLLVSLSLSLLCLPAPSPIIRNFRSWSLMESVCACYLKAHRYACSLCSNSGWLPTWSLLRYWRCATLLQRKPRLRDP